MTLEDDIRAPHTVTVEFDGVGAFAELKFACHEDGASDPKCWMACPEEECEEGCYSPNEHVRTNTGECQVVLWLNESDDIGSDVIGDHTSFAGIPIRYVWHGEGVDWAFDPPALPSPDTAERADEGCHCPPPYADCTHAPDGPDTADWITWCQDVSGQHVTTIAAARGAVQDLVRESMEFIRDLTSAAPTPASPDTASEEPEQYDGCSCPDGDGAWHDLGAGDCMYSAPTPDSGESERRCTGCSGVLTQTTAGPWSCSTDTCPGNLKLPFRAAPAPVPVGCEVCGHEFDEDGCTGEPTPSDRWAGVSPSACDCDDPVHGVVPVGSPQDEDVAHPQFNEFLGRVLENPEARAAYEAAERRAQDEDVEALAALIVCPWCDVEPSKPCREWGRRVEHIHPDRIKVARTLLASGLVVTRDEREKSLAELQEELS